MKSTEAQARERLRAHDHAVLCTVHPIRGVDAVPVAFAMTDEHLGIPVDLVKPKSSTRLQRERNLEADDRATLLVEHWDSNDWSQLWWVRAELRWEPRHDATTDVLADLLASRYSQYQEKPFARILLFRITALTGWSGSEP